MMISVDGQAVLMACSHVGLSNHSGLAPFTLREWNSLARKIANSSLKTPGGLLGVAAETLTSELEIPEENSSRLSALLQRGATLAMELERLESLGIWVITRADEGYPKNMKERLGDASPPVLFGAGELRAVSQAGLAVVGSRNIDDTGTACAESIGQACAASGLTVFSGGARGTDALAMHAAIESGGKSVGVLADSLERSIREPRIRAWIEEDRLTVLTPYSPKAGFSVGAAMGRNKLIYTLADYALVVSSDADTGGTWAGATEALRAGWIPIFVRDGDNIPAGNRKLLQKGAIAFPAAGLSHPTELSDWLAEHAANASVRNSLFA